MNLRFRDESDKLINTPQFLHSPLSGDTIVVNVQNDLTETTSIHWHGMKMIGVSPDAHFLRAQVALPFHFAPTNTRIEINSKPFHFVFCRPLGWMEYLVSMRETG